MSVALNEVASLMQQLDSMMDDSNRQIIAIDIGSIGASVLLNSETFLSEFAEFTVVVDESLKFPYRLTTSIGGVEFTSALDAERLVGLKKSMPDQWKYVSRKVQVEVE